MKRSFLKIIVIRIKGIINIGKEFYVIFRGRCKMRFIFWIIRGKNILIEFVWNIYLYYGILLEKEIGSINIYGNKFVFKEEKYFFMEFC